MAAPSTLILQSDWDSVLREEGNKVWVTFKSGRGLASIHGELQCIGMSSDGNPYIEGSQGFAVNSITRKSVSVTYDGDEGVCSCRFQAPSVNFSNIHQQRKQVLCLDVTAGGLAVSCDSDNKFRLWTSNNGEVRRELEGHLGDVYTCRFFPSGIVVLSGGTDMQVKIWSVETGECVATLRGHHSGVADTAIVDRGRNIVSCSKDGTVKLWDVGQQTCLSNINDLESGSLNACSLGQADNTVDLGEPTQASAEREVMTEGKMLLLASETGGFIGVGLHSRKKIFSLKCSSAVNCCTFLSSSLCVCGTQDGQLEIIDIRNTSTPLVCLKESRGAILSVLPYKDGFFSSTGDGSCFFVGGPERKTIIELTGPDCDPVYTIAYDGSTIYSGCRDGLIRKYNL